MSQLIRPFGTLTAVLAAFAAVLHPSIAMAQEGAAAGGGHSSGLMAMAIAIGIGIAAFGGAAGQSRAVAAALEGIARNPNAADKVFVPMVLGLALIESLVLFTWVLMYQLIGKI